MTKSENFVKLSSKSFYIHQPSDFTKITQKWRKWPKWPFWHFCQKWPFWSKSTKMIKTPVKTSRIGPLIFSHPQPDPKCPKMTDFDIFLQNCQKLTIFDQNLIKPGQFDTVLSLQPSSDPPHHLSDLLFTRNRQISPKSQESYRHFQNFQNDCDLAYLL